MTNITDPLGLSGERITLNAKLTAIGTAYSGFGIGAVST